MADDGYCQGRHDLLAKYGLKVWAISNHLVGQAVCDLIDERHEAILPPRIWGDGDPEGVRTRAAAELANTARAAARLGVSVVNGFTGSSIWHLLYSFPPNKPGMIDQGYQDFADRFNPILDVFDDEGIRFALEVHPTEIAFDTASAQRALDALGVTGKPSGSTTTPATSGIKAWIMSVSSTRFRIASTMRISRTYGGRRRPLQAVFSGGTSTSGIRTGTGISVRWAAERSISRKSSGR